MQNRVKKASLQSQSGKSPNLVAVDKITIQLNDQRYWLYAAVDPHAG